MRENLKKARQALDVTQYEEIMRGLAPGIVDEVIRSLCSTLVGKGLSFRQAELMLDLAKEALKDAKI